MKANSKENYLLFFVLLIFVLEASFFFTENNKRNINFLKEEKKIEEVKKVMDNISIQAKALSIFDQTSSRKIYGRNDNIALPIASLAKIMTVITALGDSNLDTIVSISASAIRQEGNYGFFVDEKFKIKDLAKITLIGSANDGAYSLASNDLLEKMNMKAKKLGMENTKFFNFTGLDYDKEENEGLLQEAGAFSSAEDVNNMVMYALKAHPDVFKASAIEEINIKSESGFNHNIKNTNVILKKIPNIIFSKTGFTPLAGGNLSIVYKDKYDHEIIITILGSTIDERFTDMEKIINALYNLDYINEKVY